MTPPSPVARATTSSAGQIPVALNVNGQQRHLKLAPGRHCSTRFATTSTSPARKGP